MDILNYLKYIKENFENIKNIEEFGFDPKYTYKPPEISYEKNTYNDKNYTKEDYEKNGQEQYVETNTSNITNTTDTANTTDTSNTIDTSDSIDTSDIIHISVDETENEGTTDNVCKFNDILDFNCYKSTKIIIWILIVLSIIIFIGFISYLVYNFSSKQDNAPENSTAIVPETKQNIENTYNTATMSVNPTTVKPRDLTQKNITELTKTSTSNEESSFLSGIFGKFSNKKDNSQNVMVINDNDNKKPTKTLLSSIFGFGNTDVKKENIVADTNKVMKSEETQIPVIDEKTTPVQETSKTESNSIPEKTSFISQLKEKYIPTNIPKNIENEVPESIEILSPVKKTEISLTNAVTNPKISTFNSQESIEVPTPIKRTNKLSVIPAEAQESIEVPTPDKNVAQINYSLTSENKSIPRITKMQNKSIQSSYKNFFK